MINVVIDGDELSVDLKYGNRAITLKVDTGAPYSFLSIWHVEQLLRLEHDAMLILVEDESKKNYIRKFCSYSGGQVSCILCRITNVLIGDTKVEEFLFYLNIDTTKKSTPLLGMDFIKLCSGTVKFGGGLNLSLNSKFNPASYEGGTLCQINEINVDSYNSKSRFYISDELPDIL